MKNFRKSISLKRAIATVIIFCFFQGIIWSQLLVPEKTELYRDDVVPRVDIMIVQESLDFILDPENRESDELFDATFIFRNKTVHDTLENIGFRLRGNTSRGAKKKSFKIDLNAFVPGRKYYGVQKINLNGQHNDPTSARAKICADLADRFEIPSMRTNHVELYINNEYYGLYTNTEHIDQNYVKKRFGNKNGNLYKCLYPADLNYKGDNPESYKEVIFGRRNYELKNNLKVDDYSDFAALIKAINLSSDADFKCELEKVFNVDQYLKVIIFDIFTGNWDGPIYNKNNFYLYHNQATGLFEYIPYDLDNTLGIDWVNRDWGERNIYEWSKSNEARPLYNRIMENEEYRNRFTFYMQDILLNIYDETNLYPYLNELRDRLKPYIEDDTYYTLDYGFDVEDFQNGFEFKLGYNQTDYGIKEFIQTRLIASFTQLYLEEIPPIITDINNNNNPNASEGLKIQAKIIDDENVENVEFCYWLSNNQPICFPMLDDGNSNDNEANDGIYGSILPAFNESGYLKYVIRATDDNGETASYPECGRDTIIVDEESLTLAINEFMASNNTIILDENDEYDDWIELYNYGTSPIYLGDKYLTDNPENKDKWIMPNYTIQGGEYLLFWADDDRNQGTFHTNFKLSKDEEYIGIYDNDETLIDQIEYTNQESDISFGRIPNGTGNFIAMQPTPNAQNIGTTSIKETGISNLISISPNPTNGEIRIITEEKMISIELFNAIGQKIKGYSPQNNILELPNSSGIYFLKIWTDSNISISKKIIKS